MKRRASEAETEVSSAGCSTHATAGSSLNTTEDYCDEADGLYEEMRPIAAGRSGPFGAEGCRTGNSAGITKSNRNGLAEIGGNGHGGYFGSDRSGRGGLSEAVTSARGGTSGTAGGGVGPARSGTYADRMKDSEPEKPGHMQCGAEREGRQPAVNGQLGHDRSMTAGGGVVPAGNGAYAGQIKDSEPEKPGHIQCGAGREGRHPAVNVQLGHDRFMTAGGGVGSARSGAYADQMRDSEPEKPEHMRCGAGREGVGGDRLIPPQWPNRHHVHLQGTIVFLIDR